MRWGYSDLPSGDTMTGSLTARKVKGRPYIFVGLGVLGVALVFVLPELSRRTPGEELWRQQSLTAAQQLSASVLSFAASPSHSRPDAGRFPNSNEDWLLLTEADLVKPSLLYAGPVIPDATKWYYAPPLAPPNPGHPRPIIIENPMIRNWDAAAVGFDDGTAAFLEGSKLWDVIGGIPVVPDSNGLPIPGQTGKHPQVLARPSF